VDDAPFPTELVHFRGLFQVSLVEDRTGLPPSSTDATAHTQTIMMGATRIEDSTDILLHGKMFSYAHPEHRLNLLNHNHGLRLAILCINRNVDTSGAVMWKTTFDSKAVKDVISRARAPDNSSCANTKLAVIVHGACPKIPCGPEEPSHQVMEGDLALAKKRNALYISGMSLRVSAFWYNQFLALARY